MRVSPRRLTEAAVALSLLVGAWTVADARRSDHAAPPAVPGVFDYYVLSLSVAPSFCALAGDAQKRQCDRPSDAAYRDAPLTLHGLWPNRADTGTRQQPQACSGEPLPELPADLRTEMAVAMPGAADGLDRYEWRKHGSCSGLDPATYFRAAFAAVRAANAAIGGVIRERGWFGRDVRITDLLAAVAARDPELARAMVVDCRFARKRPGATASVAYVREIRVVLNRSFAQRAGAPGGTLGDGAYLPLVDVGLHANSGCPGGAGFFPAGY